MVLSKILHSDKLWLVLSVGAGVYWLLVRKKIRADRQKSVMLKKIKNATQKTQTPLKKKQPKTETSQEYVTDSSDNGDEYENGNNSECSAEYELHRALVEGVLLPIVQRHCESNSVLGFMCNWNMQVSSDVSVQIELCTHSEFSSWFEICCVNHIPKDLVRVLADHRIMKVGLNVVDEAINLAQHFNINVRGTLDLRHLVELVYTKKGKWVHEKTKEDIFAELSDKMDDAKEAILMYKDLVKKIDPSLSQLLLFEPLLDKRYSTTELIG